MADWNRQGDQQQDWSERQQSGRQERGPQSSEWRRESEQFQPDGSQGGYGGQPGGHAESEINGLNRCLRSELSAIETYRQALDRDRQHYGSHMEFQRLSEILRDHEDAAARLREAIRSRDGEPSNDAGAWGTWSKIIMGAAKLFGDKAALKASKEGEESGLADYERYMREHARSQDDLRLISELMARQQRHARELDELIAALTA